MRLNNKSYFHAFLILSFFVAQITHAYDWINHIQSSLSDSQIMRDVSAMHTSGMTVQQTIEGALRTDHARILNSIKLQLNVPDDVWHVAMHEVKSRKAELLSVLYSKDAVHSNNWLSLENSLCPLENSAKQIQWNDIRSIAKNTCIDLGINPQNIYLHPNDADYLNYLQNAIDEEPSWWRRQTIKFKKNLNQWNYSLSPIWCTCFQKKERPQAEIVFNISAMNYFNPAGQRGLFVHELTHITEGHLQEHGLLNELETEYGSISNKNWQQYHYSLEHMADQLPALKSIKDAETACDHLHPIMDMFITKFSSHPLAFYRKRALRNIVRYLQAEQETIEQTKKRPTNNI